MTKAVTDTNFATDVLSSGEPVVVDFWAEWCGPCKMIAPALEELSKEFDGKVKIVKLNIDENQQTAIRYGVRSIPTLIAFRGGREIARQSGAMSKAMIERWIGALPSH